MSAAVRLCVACVLLSTSLTGGAAGRDVDADNSTTTTSPADSDVERSARCVDIATDLSACRRLGYRQVSDLGYMLAAWRSG